ncbi:MAG: aminomethyl-transferring glycine dehydrogenase subunit GcvPB [Clostridiaceae bacterium]
MTRSAYPLIFERSHEGRKAYDLPALDVPKLDGLLPESLLSSTAPDLPEAAEVDVVRHYINLSRRNFGVDNGFYPLGSCTMKYNPKINEEVVTLFNDLHPLADEDQAAGALELMLSLDHMLCAITGMDKFTLQPAAGAQGEVTGLMILKAYHDMRQDFARNVIIIPDSAHGTNPASAVMAGFTTRELKSAPNGGIDLDALRAAVGPDTAGLMLTNPSTLGLFEVNIQEVAKIVHDAGGLLYYDGANLNAIMGVVRPGDMGFDVMHLNLHKTFSTPHGGGGPGSGPVGVKKELIPFLPYPVVFAHENGPATLDFDRPLSIGRVRSFYGNFSVLARTYAYILSLGAEGLKEASQIAVLNANYVMEALKDTYGLPYPRTCMHECVFTPGCVEACGIHTSDIAKALIDFGFHPPTIYFPLIVHEAIMVEPTESESRETLDAFIAAMKKIAALAVENPEVLRAAPQSTPVGRPDEVAAARKPIVRYQKP